jgi:predicted lipoprotein with Yx(FWY)xxD motif
MKINASLMRMLVVVSVTSCASIALAQTPAKMTNGALTDAKGMTLYTFDRDTPNNGKSACNGPCADNWPPLMARDSDKAQGDYTIVTRADGSKQWAFKGKPLYLWAKDKKPGDKNGDGYNNVWHAAAP